MAKTSPLSWKKLRAAHPEDKIAFKNTTTVPEPKKGALLFQPRAVKSLDLAVSISGNEYNVYVAGSSGLGRTYLVKSHLEPLAAKSSPPPDVVYLHNFRDPDRPMAVELPAGEGRLFKDMLSQAVSELKKAIPARFEQEAHVKHHETLIRQYQDQRAEVISHMEDMAQERDFNLEMDEQGALVLTPLVEGKPVSQEEFEDLDAPTRKHLKSLGDELLSRMNVHIRRMSRNEETFKEDERGLYRKSAETELDKGLAELEKRFSGQKKLAGYLSALRTDILDNIDWFTPAQPQGQAAQQVDPHQPPEDPFDNYEANLFVDNSETRGAPIVVEDHPTHFNLLGCIERESEMGALLTGYRLIKPGALHRANHGYLIMNVEDLLSNAHSWEGLLRALRSGKAKIEDPGEPDQVRAKTIEPEPVDVSVRIILVGSDEIYEALLQEDERFRKHFKLGAHLQSTCDRTAKNVRSYLGLLARIVREADLLPFTRDALAGLVEISSRLCEDQKKLSLHLPILRERMIEASAQAWISRKKMVDREALRRSVESRIFRSNLVEAEFMADYDREIIKVATSGRAVGVANGLSVTYYGDYEFGLPHQISCTIGVGHGGILDLEREGPHGRSHPHQGHDDHQGVSAVALRQGQAHRPVGQPGHRAELRGHRGRLRLGRGAGRPALGTGGGAHRPVLCLHRRGEPVRGGHGRGRGQPQDRGILRGLPQTRAHGQPGSPHPQGQRGQPHVARRGGSGRQERQVPGHPRGMHRGSHGASHRDAGRQNKWKRELPQEHPLPSGGRTAQAPGPAGPGLRSRLPPLARPRSEAGFRSRSKRGGWPRRGVQGRITANPLFGLCFFHQQTRRPFLGGLSGAEKEKAMLKAWIETKKPEFVRDMFRDFCTATLILEGQFTSFDSNGDADFEVLRDLLGKEGHKGLLWRIKDTAHNIFRSDPAESTLGQFLDWALGYIFHETMKLKEDAYQRLNYAPWFAELRERTLPDIDPQVVDELFQLLSQTLESMRREIQRIRFITAQCRKLLPVYLKSHRDNALLARYIHMQNKDVRKVFGEEYEMLVSTIWGDEPEVLYVLASQSLRQGGWVEEAAKAMDEAWKLNPDNPKVAQEKSVVDNWCQRVCT